MAEPSVRWQDDRGDVSAPIAGESNVYAAAERGLVAYDPAEGDVVWEAETAVDEAPSVAYGRGCVLCSADTADDRHASRLRLFTAEDGVERWSITIDGTLPTTEVAFLDADAIAAVVFDADAGRSIQAFDVASGDRMSWVPIADATKVRMAGETIRGTADDLVFAAPDTESLVAIDVTAGERVWEYGGSPGDPPPFAAAPTFDTAADRVFVGSATGLDVLRRATGEVVASDPDGERRPATRVAGGPGSVYVAMDGRHGNGPDDPARLTAYDAHGNREWETTLRPPETVRSLAACDDDTVLLQTYDGDARQTSLRSVDAAGGTVNWTVTDDDRATLVSRFAHDATRRRPGDGLSLLTESHGGLVGVVDGEKAWRTTDEWTGLHEQRLATVGEAAFVATDDGVLHALERPGLASRVRSRFG
ncbi:MAG: PQQ-binding-like beta-propeller repeat protein [Haloquadratum sp.]